LGAPEARIFGHHSDRKRNATRELSANLTRERTVAGGAHGARPGGADGGGA
jgi:hypothetical protein